MRLIVGVLACSAICLCAGDQPVKRQVPYGGGGGLQRPAPRYQGGGLPQGFRPSPSIDEDSAEDIDRNTVQPTPQPYRPQLQYRPPQEQRGRPQEYAIQGKRPPGKNPLKEEEEEEEKEEPDRLTQLLPQSKFNCQGKNTGYYADEGLQCEVFHYCQDNARHSWICPEGFLFHQVHLICMPPSHDNICTQSSQFHFVNDFLYKPINAEEHQSKPNVTLRYSDRYYPENFYEEEQIQQVVPQATPRPRPPPQQQQAFHQTPRPVPHQPPQILRQPNQVFHSPEEVNIPLQHRRPGAQLPPPHRQFHPSQQSSEEYEY
uniref:Chitin-binding type-2 domain-containing protein n=2 Tax=Lygus hesperus TaxID=30085 RepID=A0A0K8S4W0_LYGHE